MQSAEIRNREAAGLLRTLVSACEVQSSDPEVIRTAALVADGQDLLEHVTHVATTLGLRVRPLRADASVAAAAARADMPVVGLDQTGRALVLDRFRGGRVRLRLIGESRTPRWVTVKTLQQLTAMGPVDWLLVEPAFPAGPMGGATNGLSPLRRLGFLLRAERREILIVLIYAVATGLLGLATPLSIQALISWLAFGALIQPIMVLSALLFGFLSIAALLRGMQRYAVEIIQRRIFVRLLQDVSERLSRVRISAFDRSSGPELVNRFFDVLTVQKAAAILLVEGASAALQAIVGLAILGFYHPVLFLFDLVVIVAMIGVIVPLGRGATRTAIHESKRKYEAAAWIEELARHPATIKLGGGSLARARTDDVARAYLGDRSNHFRIYFRQYIGMLAVQVGISAALLLLSGWLVLEGQLTIGQLVASEFIVASALVGFSKITSKMDTWYDLMAGVDKLGSLADLPQDRRDGRTPSPTLGPASVQLDNVELGPVKGYCGHLQPGEVAWWTVSSSQRRHLADLITGLRTPTSGSVRRDGLDLRSIQPEAGFAEVGLARGSEPLIASIRDNVALARAGVDDGKVWEVLAKVGLADQVASLTEGLGTSLGPLGRPLCPDQVARLLVARILAACPRLIVIDGLFDGCTTQTTEALLNALKDSTTVVVLSVRDAPVLRGAV